MNAIYSITEYDTIQVLTINSLLDEWQNRQILKELQQRIDTGLNHYVVDLGSLGLLNSSGLNFLLSLLSRTQKNGGALILANASKRIQHVLNITKLSTIFTTKSSITSAVREWEINKKPVMV